MLDLKSIIFLFFFKTIWDTGLKSILKSTNPYRYIASNSKISCFSIFSIFNLSCSYFNGNTMFKIVRFLLFKSSLIIIFIISRPGRTEENVLKNISYLNFSAAIKNDSLVRSIKRSLGNVSPHLHIFVLSSTTSPILYLRTGWECTLKVVRIASPRHFSLDNLVGFFSENKIFSGL